MRLSARSIILVTVAALSGAIAAGVFTSWRSWPVEAQNSSPPPPYLASGVVIQVQFPTANSSRTEVESAVDSHASFIEYRSGVRLTSSQRTVLTNAQMAWATNNGTPVITVDSLATDLADWKLDAIAANLSDAEINEAVEVMKGFYAPDLPDAYKGGRHKHIVGLSSEGGPLLTPENLHRGLTSMRDGIKRDLVRSDVRDKAYKSVSRECDWLRSFRPANFDRYNLSPFEAAILTWSDVTQDTLGWSRTELVGVMQEVHVALAKTYGSYPDPAPYKAYGNNGYLKSTPANLYVTRLADLLERVMG